jgi:hypothetical protein
VVSLYLLVQESLKPWLALNLDQVVECNG